jgi:hypothetical protein
MVHAHYTTLDGLEGMLRTGLIWATSVRYLNDQREIDDALEMIAQGIQSGKKQPRYSHLVPFMEQVEKAAETVAKTAAETLFVASFSAEDDLLSQWRAYGTYCVAVDLQAFTSGTTAQVFDCVYSREEKHKILGKFLSEQHQEFKNTNRLQDIAAAATYIADELAVLAARFKDPAFAEEKERRVIVSQESDYGLSFRAGRNYFVPYISLPLKIEHIKHIRIGPTRDVDLAKRSLEHLLRIRAAKEDVAAPQVMVSRVPLR